MKNINHIFILIILFTLNACSGDFLDVTPESEIEFENFWKTPSDAETGIIGCYDALQPDSYFGFDYFVLGDVRADNCLAGGDNINNTNIDNFNVRPTNDIVSRFWSQVYVAIARTNTAIDRITLIEDALFEDGQKDVLLGEAHFLRGLHYFYLVQLYGGVPVIT